MEISNIKYQKAKLQIKIKKRFKNFAFWIVILIFNFWILNFNCYAQPISSTELINNAKQYDGKAVVYQGEAIGDIMVRGEYAWINVNDGKTAIGVWVDKKSTEDIRYTGTYKTKGDLVELEGIFNRSCKEHGGDLDIHAASIRKIKEGFAINEPLDSGKVRLGLEIGIILFLVLLLKVYRNRRHKA